MSSIAEDRDLSKSNARSHRAFSTSSENVTPASNRRRLSVRCDIPSEVAARSNGIGPSSVITTLSNRRSIEASAPRTCRACSHCSVANRSAARSGILSGISRSLSRSTQGRSAACNKKTVDAGTKRSVGSDCGLRIDIAIRLHRTHCDGIDALQPDGDRRREEISRLPPARRNSLSLKQRRVHRSGRKSTRTDGESIGPMENRRSQVKNLWLPRDGRAMFGCRMLDPMKINVDHTPPGCKTITTL